MKIEDFISNLKEKVEALQVTEFKSESVEIKVVNDNLKKSVFSDKNSYEVKAKINGIVIGFVIYTPIIKGYIGRLK